MNKQNSIIMKVTLFLIIALVFTALVIPSKVVASESLDLNKSNNLQEKIAKSYANKFCNAIGIGVSQESAIKLTINENKQSKFNPSLWLELASSGEKNLNQINQDELAGLISSKVIRNCGYAIGLSGQNGIETFQGYFISIKNEIENK